MIREEQEVTRDNAQAVIDLLHEYKKRVRVSDAFIAKSLGVAPSTLSQVMSFKYAGDWQSIIRDLDRWHADELQRESAHKPTEYVETAVAKEILTVAGFAVKLRTIGLVYGPSGIGKSLALKAVADEFPASVYVSMESAATSPLGVLDAISRALRIDPGMGQSQRILSHRIKQTLLNTSRLLIIDEIHKLTDFKNDAPFHVLRDLYDGTNKAPQLWCGTTNLISYFQRGEGRGREPLAQLRRRIGVRRDLLQRTRKGGDGGHGERLYNLDEIRAIFRKAKIRLAADATKYLMLLANLPDSGALGACYNLVVMAIEINDGKAIITAEMLRSAQTMLLQDRECDALEDQIHELDTPPMARAG